VNAPREVCVACGKARVTCVCEHITPVHNRTEIVVLQHPRERGHAIGTARFVELGLARSRVVIAGSEGGLRSALDLPADAAVLYPSPEAEDLSTLAPEQMPKTLLVIDGTWAHAHTVVRENPWIKTLRPVRFTPESESRYRIRREPRADYVSTLEAVVEALRIMEPGLQGLDGLLRAFDHMIDVQIAYRETRPGTGRIRKVSRPFVGVPPAIGEHFARLVVVDLVFTRAPDYAHVLARFVARRMHDGATFARDGFAALDEASLEAFRAFLPHKALIGAWAPRVLQTMTAKLPDHKVVNLRAAYTSHEGLGKGAIDAIVAHHGLAPEETEHPWDAGLAKVLAVVEFLRAEALAHAARRVNA
jgi:DTW domain-containing protein YfiP